VLGGAEWKDLGGAHFTYAVQSFSTTEPAPGVPATIFPWGLIRPINPEFKNLAQTCA
jgi:hypothetical protein